MFRPYVRVFCLALALASILSGGSNVTRGSAQTEPGVTRTRCPNARAYFPLNEGRIGWTYRWPYGGDIYFQNIFGQILNAPHQGIDIFPPLGATTANVYPILDGTVARAGTDGVVKKGESSITIWYGSLNVFTYYSHIRVSQDFSDGADVSKNLVVATVDPDIGHLHASIVKGPDYNPEWNMDASAYAVDPHVLNDGYVTLGSGVTSTADPSDYFEANLNWDHGARNGVRLPSKLNPGQEFDPFKEPAYKSYDGNLPQYKYAPGPFTPSGMVLPGPAESNKASWCTYQTTINLDLDGNGSVNILDYNVLLDCYTGEVRAQPIACNPTKKAAADLDGDGVVNRYDYLLFLRLLPQAVAEHP